jgi:hypothetical protein
MSYAILADPIRGWGINHKGQKIGLNKKRKSGLARIKKYRKMLKFHKINFREVFVPAGVKHFPEEVKELHQNFTEYDPCQDLYVFVF